MEKQVGCTQFEPMIRLGPGVLVDASPTQEIAHPGLFWSRQGVMLFIGSLTCWWTFLHLPGSQVPPSLQRERGYPNPEVAAQKLELELS